MISNKTTSWLEELRREVEAHPAVNHLLLCRAATHPYSRFDYRNFGLQHHALVGYFTRYMELLLVHAPTSEQKLWLAKVLVDEYGEGSDGKDHTTLYREFLAAAGAAADEEKTTPLCPEVFDFVRSHLRIVTEEPFLVGLGALGPGHEWAIPKMFSHLIPGLRRVFADDEILYFLLHCEQDIDHGAWMEETLASLACSEEDRAQVRRVAMLSLDARRAMWTGVERRVTAARQPVGLEAAERGVVGARDDTRRVSPGRLTELAALVAGARF